MEFPGEWRGEVDNVLTVCLVVVGEGSGYYEVCLAVIEGSTVYYLYQSLCTEVSLPRTVEDKQELRLTAGVDTVTVGWSRANTSGTVRLTVRQFGEMSPVVSRLVTDNNSFSHLETGEGLRPATPYTVCIQPVTGGGEEHSKSCQEVHSLPAWLSRETAVATSAAVSSSSTMIIIFLAWCCCYGRKRRRGPGDKADCNGLDVNENESCQVKHEADCSANNNRLWHQKCSSAHSEHPLSHSR